MSLPEVAATLLRQKLTVIAVVVAAFAAVAAVTFSLPTEYEARATLAVGGARAATQSANPVEYDQTLARTYGELLRTSSASAAAAAELPFRISAGDLAEQVAFEAVGGTALLRIAATDEDPHRAQLIANAYATTFVRTQQEAITSAARQALKDSNRRLRELALLVRKLEQSTEPDAIADLELARTRLAAERDSYRARRQGIALQGSVLSIASPASLPGSPARPRPKLYLLLGAAFALLLGALAGVLRDTFDTRLRSEDDVMRLLGAPVLGRVPKYGRTARRDDILDDAFHALRSNIELYDPGGRLHTIGVTGAARGQGASFVAVGLAEAFALVGSRVAAVDCDLREPAVGTLTLLGADDGPGLSDALISPSAAVDMLKPTDLARLQVLPAGPRPANAAVLLTRERLAHVVSRLRAAVDRVICDMPPVTHGADAAAAAASVEAAIIVVDARSAQRSALKAAREQLENSETRLLGIVLNRATVERRSNVPTYRRSSESPGETAERPPELPVSHGLD